MHSSAPCMVCNLILPTRACLADIQGTACVAVSGIFGALTVQGKPASDITKQRIVLVGAGSAGMGVAHFIRRSTLGDC